ncbi:osmotically inducible protein OsmC [Polaribacter sp. ALD11]|uniref:OsmC family protein n=1 Tax=Polaribacter sp. ALD11 TaxID=2058137 RepID=UPI000C30DC2D|nr:OsmC family protein [Polaribacter sp. ALD11]AUC86551.1 osmotically inducible protein OsmC [Polaribacter sp. ALD11]
MANSKVVLSSKNYLAEAKMRKHFAVIDEPVNDGGDDNGPTPVEYLLTAIGSCVSITLRMYAERKGWDVGKITVNVSQVKDENSTHLTEEISFEKDVTEEQKKRLLVIAGKCPVAKMVKGETEIATNIL